MQIDRRNLLLGATATVATTSLPALAAPFAGRNFRYRNLVNFPIIDRAEAWRGEGFSRQTELTSIWHLDWGYGGNHPQFPFGALIRHVASGYTYRHAPERDDWRALRPVCVQGQDPWRPDVDSVQVVGRAAYFACSYGFCVLRRRPEHKGAVFLRYVRIESQNPYVNPETSDAPRIRLCALGEIGEA